MRTEPDDRRISGAPAADTHVDTDDPLLRPERDGRVPLVALGRRRWLVWLAAVVVVAMVGEAAARMIVPRVPDEIRWYDAAAQRRIDLLDERAADVDVVFAGTSAAWQAFVPGAAPPGARGSGLNVGLAGAVPTVTGRWLLDEVVPRARPETVVWGLTPLDFAPAYGRSQEDAYDDAVETAPGRLAGFDRAVSDISVLVRSRRLLRNPSALVGAEAAAITGPGGERIDFRVDVGEERGDVQRARLAGFAIDERDRAAIIDTVGALRGAGIRVVLVELPLPDRFVDTLPDPVHDGALVRETIVEVGREVGADVVLMRDVLGDSNFVDFIHLDADGAARTTRWFGEALGLLDADRGSGGPVGGFPDGCRTSGAVDQFGFPVPVGVCPFDR